VAEDALDTASTAGMVQWPNHKEGAEMGRVEATVAVNFQAEEMGQLESVMEGLRRWLSDLTAADPFLVDVQLFERNTEGERIKVYGGLLHRDTPFKWE
jgi:hypothetical protein